MLEATKLLIVKQTTFVNSMLVIYKTRHRLLSKHLMEKMSLADKFSHTIPDQGVIFMRQ